MNYTLMFIFFLMMSLMLLLSSYSWWMMWISLEMMTFFFIPWMMNEKSSGISSKSFFYFIVQSLASILFIFSNILSSIIDMNLIVILSMLLKLGSFPFHSWMFKVMENLDWMKFFVLSSIMKLGPLFILSIFLPVNWVFYSIIPFSMLIMLGSLNLWSIRMIFIYSSIVHLSWMIMSCCINQSIMVTYFFSYSLLMMMISFFFYKNHISSFKDLMKFFLLSDYIQLGYFMLMIFSFMGIPPFLSFLMKILVLKMLILSNCLIEALLMSIFSIFPIYIYMKVIMFFLFFSNLENLSFSVMKKESFFSLLDLSLLLSLMILLW